MKQSEVGPSISHQYFSAVLRCQKSKKNQIRQVYVVVPKPCVLGTRSYLAFACATVVSVVIAASKTGTTKPAGRTDPRFLRVLLILPVWDPIRAMNWVGIHELSAHWKGRPYWRMDFHRVLSSPAAEGC